MSTATQNVESATSFCYILARDLLWPFVSSEFITHRCMLTV